MTTVSISIISIFVALLSLLVSFLNFISNKAELIILSDLSDSAFESVINGEITVRLEKNKTTSLEKGILLRLSLLNSSPKDIAFFNLHFKINGKIEEAFTKQSYGWSEKEPKFILHDLKRTMEIPVPNNVFGVFKAHSCNVLYLYVPITMTPIPKSAIFHMDYSVRKFPFVGKKSRYRSINQKLNFNKLSTHFRAKEDAMMNAKRKNNISPKHYS